VCTDWDGDGLFDILVSHADRNMTAIHWYRNVGKKGEPKFAKPEPVLADGKPIGGWGLWVCDIDSDGDDDLLASYGGQHINPETKTPGIHLYRNEAGAGKMPVLTSAGFLKSTEGYIGPLVDLNGQDGPNDRYIWISTCDLNGDGVLDLIQGHAYDCFDIFVRYGAKK
jgi:hypothetical protein